MSTRVYVHIGLPKTGTTFLQATMWEGRDALAEAGCLIPGERRPSAWWAASDLLGRRPRGSQGRKIPGAWDAVATQLREWPGGRAIFSEELLSIANRRQVRKLVDDLGDSEVHAVVTVRDLGRVLPSLWQQEIRKGRTWTWPEFLASVRDPQQGSVTAAAAFWMRFDLDKVLGAWAAELPPERIHVVVLPAHGSPSSILLERFARAVDLDPALLAAAAPTHRSNPALGADEVEVLRRLNLRLADSLNERQYVRVVVNGVIPALEARTGSTRVQIPAEHRDWLDATSAALVESLRSSSYDVIGDLDDLTPAPAGTGRRPDEASADEMLDAALHGLATLAEEHAKLWWERPEDRPGAGDTDSGKRPPLRSRLRATRFAIRRRLMSMADRHSVVAWPMNAYVRLRTARRRRAASRS